MWAQTLLIPLKEFFFLFPACSREVKGQRRSGVGGVKLGLCVKEQS